MPPLQQLSLNNLPSITFGDLLPRLQNLRFLLLRNPPRNSLPATIDTLTSVEQLLHLPRSTLQHLPFTISNLTNLRTLADEFNRDTLLPLLSERQRRMVRKHGVYMYNHFSQEHVNIPGAR